jgi:hypothetical protein
VNRLLLLGGGGGGGGGAALPPLDGVSGVTGAWSMSRKLLSAYGGSFYTDAGGGAISTIFEQSSGIADRNLTDGATSTRRPAATTAGTHSVAMADFDGTSDNLQTVQATLNLYSTSEGVIFFAGIIDAYTLNSATVWANDLIVGDNGGNSGLYGRNTGGGTIYGYNFDTNVDADSAIVSIATPVVLSWRHKSGTVFLGVNGVEGAGVASGNTTGLTGVLKVGGFAASQWGNIKLSELVTMNADPGSTTFAAIAADLLAHM